MSFRLLAGPTEVTVLAASSETLVTLLAAAGETLRAGLKKITFIPQGTVSWANGTAAAAGTNDLPAATHELEINLDDAANLQFRAAGNTAMTVVQQG